MVNYRITKYNPKLRLDGGQYLINEWTSISDIGENFGSIVFEKEEYLHVEKKYLSAINLILTELGVDTLKVVGLEKYEDEIEKNDNVDYDNIDFDTYKKSKEGQFLSKKEVMSLSKLILRENIWSYLVDDIITIKFGYDYYLNIIVNSELKCFSEIEKELGLYVEKIES